MDNDVGKRILELRKSLKKTQSEFAEGLGLKFGLISAIEVGRVPLTESNLKHLCLTFNVNEKWLRTGEGEMFFNDDTQYESELLDVFRQLSEQSRKLVLEHSKGLVELEQALRSQPYTDSPAE